jgi:hypothetical protein
LRKAKKKVSRQKQTKNNPSSQENWNESQEFLGAGKLHAIVNLLPISEVSESISLLFEWRSLDPVKRKESNLWRFVSEKKKKKKSRRRARKTRTTEWRTFKMVKARCVPTPIAERTSRPSVRSAM